eukprot:TRINITY_DN2707_c0_g4_i1.p1 TRINITY_DN2707_c0_g4~~TRINITY_DN2707_c0_g4_i1.p1  ORF type:complete len:174 (+),score=17.11 TRINITY_DN2707_c0_g4_i1:50-523(+)
MEFVLPDSVPVLEGPQVDCPLVSPGMAGERKKQRAVEYFVRNRVAIFIDVLLGALYKARPQDPIAWLLEMLVKKRAYFTEDEDTDVKALNQLHLETENKAIREYASTWKIPFLIDELLCDMLLQEPEEPETFTLSWLRWNHSSFISRHFENSKLPSL